MVLWDYVDGDGGRTVGPSVIVCSVVQTPLLHLLIVPMNLCSSELLRDPARTISQSVNMRSLNDRTNDYTWNLKRQSFDLPDKKILTS